MPLPGLAPRRSARAGARRRRRRTTPRRERRPQPKRRATAPPESQTPPLPSCRDTFPITEEEGGVFRIWILHSVCSRMAEAQLRAAFRQVDRLAGAILDFATVRLSDESVVGWQISFVRSR